MRNLLVTATAAAGLVVAGALAAPRAEAMPTALPGALAAAAQETAGVEPVAYVCRRAWRCGPWGCGWRRACWWQPGPYYGFGAYGYHRPYRHWGWHRGWHRHRHWW